MTSELAAAIAAHPGLAERLLAEHVDDGRGRCAKCPTGDQQGHQRWPCRLHLLALAALEDPS